MNRRKKDKMIKVNVKKVPLICLLIALDFLAQEIFFVFDCFFFDPRICLREN